MEPSEFNRQTLQQTADAKSCTVVHKSPVNSRLRYSALGMISSEKERWFNSVNRRCIASQ
ncbi:hypothetical protein HAX54_001836, partial [Datura stramonium]|nr:hypothetical protein [Datura stramonium]